MKQVRSESLVRRRLSSYVARKTSLGSFSDWFIPATWDIEKWAPERLEKLVNAVKGRLAEFDNGHWTESELRKELGTLLKESSIKEGIRKRKTPAPRDMVEAKRRRQRPRTK
jgi:hypothetical protein